MDFTLDKLGKFVENLTTTDEKMKDLKRKLEELNAVKEDLESRRSKELQHPRKKLKTEVELWFSNVERINGEILDLQQKIGDSNVASRGWGSLTAHVWKKTTDVKELLQQSKFEDDLVVDNPGKIGQALSTTTLFGGAAEICKKEIWAYLMNDKVNKIGVWGMGGIGKTTIMKVIHNQLLEERQKFNIVIWITVSKEMSIIYLQNRIAIAMNLSLEVGEDETVRAGKIYEWLQARKYVLILDDLWDKLCLEDVGIPEPSNGSKLLVTTRLSDVCRYLDCQQVKVPTLSEPDAWSLFSEKVGQEVLRHPDLLPIVKLVAEECAGLPLAIVIIASSMKGVCNVHEWRNALDVLKRHVQSVNKMEEKIFQQLQFSYDRLRDEKVKHCFLCFALYPEDYEIGEKDLIELWIAEGLVEEMDSMQMEIDMGHTILNKLKNSCLIENGSSHKNTVKLHDIVRDMALRITSVRPRFLVRAGMQLSEIPNMQHWKEDLEKASLMKNRFIEIPHQMPAPKCPNLTTLLLSECRVKSIPEGFFDQMKGLKILDLSRNRIKSLPNSISNLETLTTLLLHKCVKLENVPSFSKLKALKKLELGWTGIKDIPDGMEKLVNLKYLDLRETEITKMNDGILTKLTSLQCLKLFYFAEGFGEGISSVRGEKIGGLRKLEMLDVWFDGLNELNSYIQALQLARLSWPRVYHISVCPAAGVEKCGEFDGWDELFNIKWDKSIRIDGGDDICSTNDGIKIPSDVQQLGIQNIIFGLCEEEALMLSRFIIPVLVPLNSFSSLFEIDIYKCRNIKKLFSSHWVLHNLQNLEWLWVRECDEMEEIIASESELEMEMEGVTTACASASASFKFTTTLPKLKVLELRDLPELKSICGENGVMVSCDSIMQIEILDCPKLKRMSLNLRLKDDGQPYPPPSLEEIAITSEEWWSQLEWDHPNAKSLLEPYLRLKEQWW